MIEAVCNKGCLVLPKIASLKFLELSVQAVADLSWSYQSKLVRLSLLWLISEYILQGEVLELEESLAWVVLVADRAHQKRRKV